MIGTSSISVTKVNDHQTYLEDELLAIEEPLEIRLQFGKNTERLTKSISITMRTPGQDAELAIGFLFTENIIKNYGDIENVTPIFAFNCKENKANTIQVTLKQHVTIDFKKLERHFYTTSSCGVCGKSSIEAITTTQNISSTPTNTNFEMEASLLHELPNKLKLQQTIFEQTGGLHGSALFDKMGNLILMREDVGRHNALDKLIGAALKNTTIELKKSILLLSGRASFELLQKAVMANIPLVLAVGAPSSMAVATAEAFGITLVGFLRDQRFNIYSNPERIKVVEYEICKK
jgi:FdhD protein